MYMPDCLRIALSLKSVLKKDKILMLVYLYGKKGHNNVVEEAIKYKIKNPYARINTLIEAGYILVIDKNNSTKRKPFKKYLLSEQGKAKLNNILSNLKEAGACIDHPALKPSAPQAPEDLINHLLLRLQKINFFNSDLNTWRDEVLLCAKGGAKRAAAIVMWQLLLACLVLRAMSTKNHVLNDAAKSTSKKNLSSFDEIQYFKDAELLDILKSIGAISKNERSSLGNLLQIRNLAAHPNFYKFSEAKTASFFEDAIDHLEKYCVQDDA